jgi:hypothetical protein
MKLSTAILLVFALIFLSGTGCCVYFAKTHPAPWDMDSMIANGLPQLGNLFLGSLLVIIANIGSGALFLFKILKKTD